MGSSNDRSSEAVRFDLSSQDGVLQALYAVRTSDLTATERNELRDKLFTLSRSGDERLREQLQSRLAELPLSEEFTAVVASKSADSATSNQTGFARGRRTPQFSVRNKPSASEPVRSDEKPTTSDLKSDAKPDQKPAPTPQTNDTATQVAPNSSVTKQPAATNVASVTPDQTATGAAEEAEMTEESTPAPATSTPAPANPSVPSEQPVNTHSTPTEAAPPTLERIREIKHYVNERIGNPVNLVDLDNEIGRAYMSALLAAMQSVNNETGVAGTAQMQELERVFAQVETLLLQSNEAATANNDQAEEAAAQSSPPIRAGLPTKAVSEVSSDHTVASVPNQTAPAPVVSEDVDASTFTTPSTAPITEIPQGQATPIADDKSQPAAAAPIPTTEQSIFTPQPVPVDTAAQGPDIAPQASEPAKTALEELQSSESEIPSPTVEIPKEPQQEVVTQPQSSQDIPADADVANDATQDQAAVSNAVPIRRMPDQATPQTALPQPITSPQPSVAQESAPTVDTRLKELDAAAAARNKYDGDPLYAPEVDGGLDQLLMEWSLFKSSGLFGTGPNGREHPLFKKLAPEMVNDILLGKFDGSRPEIIQSITDYMNGWRYEQGVVYQPGETFETYLRRVIRYILDHND